jgi:NAD(P)-dependent dehydrogenase (short-subunit alcohol dehydrogenase family)
MSSIGGETVITLAHGNPSRIILAGRTESRATPVLAAIAALNPRVETSFIDVDLASQASVRAAAVSINASIDKIDFMINNAGITAVPTFETSEDGIELQFAANHVGPFLLTNLIIGKVLAAGKGARVANVASTGYELSGVRFEDWNFKVRAVLFFSDMAGD